MKNNKLFAVLTVVFGMVLAGSLGASADTTTYANQAAYTAGTTGNTTLDLDTLNPAGYDSYTAPGAPATLAFAGNQVTIITRNYYTIVGGGYWYKSSEVSQEGCRVDSGHMLCGRGSNLRTDDHPARPNARGIIGAAWVKCCSRLPTHLAHPLENELAVVIHAVPRHNEKTAYFCDIRPENAG